MADDSTSPIDGDAVDAILSQWRSERPELDASAKAITGRIVRLADLFRRRFNEAFSELGLKEGDYGLLAALRRSGVPYSLTPTELARTQMISSGGMTFVIDRLERQGLVARAPNPRDRRGSLVRLTAKGVRTVERAMELHVRAEQELTAGLSTTQKDQLVRGLRTLLRSVED